MYPKLAERIYFRAQSLRSGVTREMIRETASLLDSFDYSYSHVKERLRVQFGCDDDQLGWLRRQPLIDRRTIITSPAPVAIPRGVSVEHRKTSGSSGTPFHFLKDKRMTAMMDAVMWAAYQWHGISPGDKQARFWGVPQSRSARRQRQLTDFIQNRRRLSAFDVTPNGSVQFFRQLRRFRPTYVYGYPTLIHEFTRHCLAAGLHGSELHIGTIICTGEVLTDNVREDLRSFFEARVVNEYGCTESGVISLTCENGRQHMTPVAVFPEIVDENGLRVAPGETGEVIITDLYGSVSPMIRYRLNDRATLSEDAGCPCGRQLPIMKLDAGRVGSLIETPTRGSVYSAILAYTVPAEVLRFLVRQVSIDHLEAVITPGPGFDTKRTPDKCRRAWEEALAPGVSVSVKVVDEIPLAASGKMRYFVPLDG